MKKKPTIAIAPKKGEIASYLTNGKKYKIVEWTNDTLFVIISDNGDRTRCYYGEEYGCFHLNELRWTLR